MPPPDAISIEQKLPADFEKVLGWIDLDECAIYSYPVVVWRSSGSGGVDDWWTGVPAVRWSYIFYRSRYGRRKKLGA